MSKHHRLESLDALRGLTIAAMILVNNPGSWSSVYPPLLHAEWHGWTPTDLIFPFFLFIVGVAMPFSFARYLDDPDRGRRALYHRVFRRSAIIVLVGLALGGLPNLDLAEIRIPGVLQRIGVVYLITALLVLNTSRRVQLGVAAAVLFGYHALMTLVPVPGHGAGSLAPDANLAAWLDRVVFGIPHLWQNRPWDPEGLLSTLPAIATCLIGVFTGRWLRSGEAPRRIAAGLLLAAALLVLAGLAWNPFFPINKNLWTSSYVLLSAGAVLGVLALCYALIDVAGWRRWARPAIVYGRNPLAVYVLSIVVAKVLLQARVGEGAEAISLWSWAYRSLFASWLSPMNASLAFALTFVALLWLAARSLDRRGRYLRA